MSLKILTTLKEKEALAEVLEYPKRSSDALKSALSSLGWDLRGKIREFIEGGGSGWPPLKAGSLKRGAPRYGTPLYNLGKFVRYKSTGGQNPRVRVGFISGEVFSKAIRGIAKKHEIGKTVRVTPAMRRHLAALGYPLKRETKTIKIPQRPMVTAVFERERKNIPAYLEEKFWLRFKGIKTT